jgi:nitrile hydratase subunit beta
MHDLGGMHGFGPVAPTPSESPFHDDVDRRAFAVFLAVVAGGLSSGDANRQAIESIGNLAYLESSYYERWLLAMQSVLLDADVITAAELRDRMTAVREGTDPVPAASSTQEEHDELAELYLAGLRATGSFRREVDHPPGFAVGDEVATVAANPRGHTRLPRYARGRRGTVVAHHGAHVFPDSSAAGRGEDPRHLYTVRFSARELWGADGGARDVVHLDLFEPYLLHQGGR